MPPSLRISMVSYYSDVEKIALAIRSICSQIGNPQIDYTVEWHFVINDERDIDDYRALFPAHIPVTFYAGHGNIGFGAGHNLALMNSDADYLFIANPDIEIEPDTFARAIRLMESHPETGLLSPQITNVDGHIQYLCKRYPTIALLFLRAFAPSALKKLFNQYIRKLEFADEIDSGETFQPVIATGCFMLVRGDIFRRVGGFDDNFFLYFEDYDLTLRIAEHAKVFYEPSIKTIHHGGGAARKGMNHISMFVASAFKFFNKHGWKWL